MIMKRFLEYIWLDSEQNYRSKTKIFTSPIDKEGEVKPFGFELLPMWNYDGSSTGQADGKDSEVYLRPVYMVRDPFRRQCDSWLVLCDTWLPDGGPHPTNTRAAAAKIFNNELASKEKTLFGLEQEFFIRKSKKGYPLGMTKTLYEKAKSGEDIQGPFYCGVGQGNCFERKCMETTLQNLVDSGLNITGMNFEVAPGQCEFQVLNEGITAADELHLLRYILIRTAEENDLFIDLHPKPFKLNINGSGCHTNYSSKTMREENGITAINASIGKLAEKHKEHMAIYGKDNNLRMTGKHETSDMETFSSGVADRCSSIRIPRFTDRDKCGYMEDRRPSSNMDPYLVTSKIVETTLL